MLRTRLCLLVQWQTSWCACRIAAFITWVFDSFVHCLGVDFKISLQCCLVITLKTFITQPLMLTLFVLFQSKQGCYLCITLITIICNILVFLFIVQSNLGLCLSLIITERTFLESTMEVLHVCCNTWFMSFERAQCAHLMLLMFPFFVSFQI